MNTENSKRGSIARRTVRATASSHLHIGDSPEGTRVEMQGGIGKGIFKYCAIFLLILIKKGEGWKFSC